MNVAGLDLSITATGLTHEVQGEACWHTIATKDKDGDRRLTVIKDQLTSLLTGYQPLVFALVEDLPFNANAAGVTGMVHGVARPILIENGISYGTVPPSSLKKYATGKGTGTKTDMALSAYKRAGAEFGDDNQCDSWWLWVMAHDLAGEPIFDLPSVNRESLKKVTIKHGRMP